MSGVALCSLAILSCSDGDDDVATAGNQPEATVDQPSDSTERPPDAHQRLVEVVNAYLDRAEIPEEDRPRSVEVYAFDRFGDVGAGRTNETVRVDPTSPAATITVPEEPGPGMDPDEVPVYAIVTPGRYMADGDERPDVVTTVLYVPQDFSNPYFGEEPLSDEVEQQLNERSTGHFTVTLTSAG